MPCRSRVIDELARRNDIHLLYFYISATDFQRKDRRSILWTFVKQISDRDNRLPSTLTQIRDTHPESEIQELLLRYLEQETTLPVYIIVDAIDELDLNDQHWLIDTLISGFQNASRIPSFKILISAPDMNGLERVQRVNSTHHLPDVHSLGIRPEDNAGDIRSFVKSKLKNLRGEESPRTVQEEILKKLTENARGMSVALQFSMIYFTLRQQKPNVTILKSS